MRPVLSPFVVGMVEEGTAISSALEQAGFFPGIALRMIGVGENSGSLAEMLSDVSDYYEDEVERRLDRLTTLIEPGSWLVKVQVMSSPGSSVTETPSWMDELSPP